MSADQAPLRVERDDRVLRVTVDRPARHNPLSRPVLAALRAALAANAADPELKCVLLTGAGNRYFAAGGDLRDLNEVRSRDAARAMAEEARAALDVVREFPVPVVAVLNGDAIGGGAELAVACDFRIMRDGTHIGFVHGRLAIASAWGGGPDLAALVGPARALRMTARCELVEARTACDWGLADAHAADEAALERALSEFVAPILRQTPLALRACTQQARALRRGLGYDERRALEQHNFVDTWVHADHWAAADRFLGRNEGKA